jgi:hypothetical protein
LREGEDLGADGVREVGPGGGDFGKVSRRLGGAAGQIPGKGGVVEAQPL